MKDILSSPWTAVTLAIVVMTLVYTSAVIQNGTIATASESCPLRHSTCTNADCKNNEECNTGNCKGCPGCTKAKTS